MSEPTPKPTSNLAAFMSLLAALAWPLFALVVFAVVRTPVMKILDRLPQRVDMMNKLSVGVVTAEMKDAEQSIDGIKVKLGKTRERLAQLYEADEIFPDALKEPIGEIDALLHDLKVATTALERKQRLLSGDSSGSEWGYNPSDYVAGNDLSVVHIESKGGADSPAVKKLRRTLRENHYKTDDNGPNDNHGEAPRIIANPASLQIANALKDIETASGYPGITVETNPKLRPGEFIIYTADGKGPR